MSVQAISWVIEHSKHKGNSFVVLMMIANHAKSDGTGAWPSIPTLAKEARVSQRTVQYCLRRLSKKWSGIKNWHNIPAELVIDVGKGPYRTNLYSIPGVQKLHQGVQNMQGDGARSLHLDGATAMSPEPSLTVLKDKERPRAKSRADYPAPEHMSEEEWEKYLDKLDPKRKRA